MGNLRFSTFFYSLFACAERLHKRIVTLHREVITPSSNREMKDIQCPNCGTTFQVDDSTYESIVAQVRSKVFKEELQARLDEAEKQFKAREENIRLVVEKSYEDKLRKEFGKINSLNNEITRLTEAVATFDEKKASELALLEAAKAKELLLIQDEHNKLLSEKEKEIANLNTVISDNDHKYRVGLLEAQNSGNVSLQKKEQELAELRAQMNACILSAEKREAELREMYHNQLQGKQDEIDRLKDFKMRMSTKMVGESLEQHCLTLFQKAQCIGAFEEATFEKDNNAIEHSKGDFIFRDYVDGEEYVSVMFEMKNEMDATAIKHRNDDFLEKLDKDRQRKGCEYAVLVSMLEQDNELYNTGIVDMSHQFPKMLVIRPQFFLPVLRLISEASRKGFMEKHELERELELAHSQTLDLTRFEERIDKVKKHLSDNTNAAHKKFASAIGGIDKIIENLEKQIKSLRDVKANFEASDMKLLKTNEYVDENLTVKKLTYGIPTVKQMIQDAKKIS